MAAIYNTTDGPVAIDADGRVIGAHEHRTDVYVTADPLAGHIAAGRIVVTEPDPEPVADVDEVPAPKTKARNARAANEED